MPREHLLTFACTDCGVEFIPLDQSVPVKKAVWARCPSCEKRVQVTFQVTLLADKIEVVA